MSFLAKVTAASEIESAIDEVRRNHDDVEIDLPIYAVIPYRTHQGKWNDSEEMRELEDSLKTLGWEGTEPLDLIVTPNGVRVHDGNHRLAIAEKLWGRSKKIPVVVRWEE